MTAGTASVSIDVMGHHTGGSNAPSPARFPPTAKQLALLCFISGYQEAHGGVSPSYQECADGLGIVKSGVHKLLGKLFERGLIRRRYHGRYNGIRVIEILDPPAIPHAPDGAPLWLVPIRLPDP